MKGQKEPYQFNEYLKEAKITAEGVSISHRHSISAHGDDDVSYQDPGYVQLGDSSVLDTLTTVEISVKAFRQAGVAEQPLQALLVSVDVSKCTKQGIKLVKLSGTLCGNSARTDLRGLVGATQLVYSQMQGERYKFKYIPGVAHLVKHFGISKSTKMYSKE